MTDIAIAVALHVVGVVWWLGGLAFVAAVLLPELRRDPDAAIERFRAIEHRFAPQARGAVLLVGATGGWMLYRLGYWHLLGLARFWWIDAMIGFWALFFLMLFVLGPIGVLRRVMSGPLETDLPKRFARLHYLHVILLIIGLIVIAGATAGSHGLG
ncbi:MAG TPA: hypothetical protein VFK96_04690 [Gammaproteobacteria bacterium]|nr:hypothetical protein [Gammaproteobacteria bacterium]